MKNKAINKFDVVIVGAGPAGCACAYQLSGKGLSVLVIDKDTFPRDKICGDALSADVVNQLHRMDEKLASRFYSFDKKLGSKGIRFVAPNNNEVDIHYRGNQHSEAAGFISKRIDFDNFLFQEVKNKPDVVVLENQKVTNFIHSEQRIIVETLEEKFETPLVIGADGANSIVRKKLLKQNLEKDQFAAGLRQYYKGITGFHEENLIELHFYSDVLPGYFWIFPMSNNQANVGLGILASAVQSKNINIKEKLEDLISTHPKLKERFKDAEPLEDIKGFKLPLGVKKAPLSGNHFLLLGDAGSLIDPFSGEGIGNAIRSGRFAAEHCIEAHRKSKFDAQFNKKYDKVIYGKMWHELRISRSMQKLLRYPQLFNVVVNKARKNESFRLLLTSMLDNVDLKKELIKPSFYLKLLFGIKF